MPPSPQITSTTAVPSMSYCKTSQRDELMEMRSVLMEITPLVADLQESALISTTSAILLLEAASPEEEENSRTVELGVHFLSWFR